VPPAVANLLQEYMDVFPQDVPPGLPPIRGIEHQIDLIPGASLPNPAPYRTNPEEKKRSNDKSSVYWTKVIFVSLLVHALFQLFWYLRKMVLHAINNITIDSVALYLIWMICLMS
jgi:hypothetical protein